MDLKLINEFTENEKITTPLLIKSVTKGVANNGNPYLNVTFQDKTGTIEGKLWDARSEVAQNYVAGSIGIVNAEVLKYRDNLQLKVLGFEPVDQSKIKDMGRFVPVSGIPLEELHNVIDGAIEEIHDPILHAIVSTILSKTDKDFYEYPAASKNHHEFVRGLATHVYGMLRLSKVMCELYPELNKDLLYSGVILHDVGKLYELSGTILTEYTMEGKLLGHISIVQAMIYDVSKDLGYEESEQAICLRHMVLSHHGEYEYGSPVLPMLKEAEMLSYIDNIDARMNMFSKIMNDTEAGTFSQRVFSLENRSFYKPKFDSGNNE